MQAEARALCLEFEVLLGRAARTGVLSLADIGSTYDALRAQNPSTCKPRQVDLLGVLRALELLPAAAWTSPRLLLVPDLRAYANATVLPARHAHTFGCARMRDGTLLCEAPYGPAAVMDYAFHLCLLQFEARKAQNLIVQARAVWRSEEDASADGTLPLSHLAFCWGHDEATLTRCQAHSGNTLLSLLQGTQRLPVVLVHQSFAQSRAAQTGRAQAQEVGRIIAEVGLLGRPLHIFAGDTSFAACLSPYTRELRPELVAWDAQSQGRTADLQVSEDVVYHIANTFLQTDARLLGEKHSAERSVGIYHHTFRSPHGGDAAPSWRLALVDSGRLDFKLCDARLDAPRGKGAAPILLGLEGVDDAHQSALLAALIETLGEHVASILFVGDGHVQGAPCGQVQVGAALAPMRGGLPVALPSDALLPQDLAGLLDHPSGFTTLHGTPSVAFAQHVEAQLDMPAQGAPFCTSSHIRSAEALLHMSLAGARLQHVELGWVGINAFAATKAQQATLRKSRTAVALARLRRIFSEPYGRRTTTPGTPTTPAAETTPRPRNNGGRVVRLKA